MTNILAGRMTRITSGLGFIATHALGREGAYPGSSRCLDDLSSSNNQAGGEGTRDEHVMEQGHQMSSRSRMHWQFRCWPICPSWRYT